MRNRIRMNRRAATRWGGAEGKRSRGTTDTGPHVFIESAFMVLDMSARKLEAISPAFCSVMKALVADGAKRATTNLMSFLIMICAGSTVGWRGGTACGRGGRRFTHDECLVGVRLILLRFGVEFDPAQSHSFCHGRGLSLAHVAVSSALVGGQNSGTSRP